MNSDTERSTVSTDDVALSRSAGLLSGAGNAETTVKFRLSHEACDDLRKLARSFDMSTSEFMRGLALRRLYGSAQVARMTAMELDRLAGIEPTNGPGSEP